MNRSSLFTEKSKRKSIWPVHEYRKKDECATNAIARSRMFLNLFFS